MEAVERRKMKLGKLISKHPTPVNETLFAILITINGISIVLTLCLLSCGMQELNPIAHQMIALHPYLFVAYVFLLWGLLYYFAVHQSRRIGGMVAEAGELCLGTALVWFLIDATHDLTVFLGVIG